MSPKIDEIAEKLKNPPTWLWKLLGGVILIVVVWVFWYSLKKKSDEIARARTELEAEKFKAEQLVLRAKLTQDDMARREAEANAKIALDRVEAKEGEIKKAEEEHAFNEAKVKALADKDWVALNALAGIK